MFTMIANGRPGSGPQLALRTAAADRTHPHQTFAISLTDLVATVTNENDDKQVGKEQQGLPTITTGGILLTVAVHKRRGTRAGAKKQAAIAQANQAIKNE